MLLGSFKSWRAALAAALLLMPFASLRAQAPQHFVPLPAPIPRPPVIAIAGPLERPVVLQSVKVDAEIAGSVALTRVEMVFFNPNRRALEGELQFPLLDGQSIVGFALDVDGSCARRCQSRRRAAKRCSRTSRACAWIRPSCR